MKRNVKYIAIHCTGASQNQSVESILRYWREVKGWKNPGYHRLISADGTVHNLLPFDKVSNGVEGYNSVSIHICYIGGQHGDDRTEAQKASLLNCIYEAIEYINDLEGLPEIEKINAKKNPVIIQGHLDFPDLRIPKDCPNFNAKQEYEWITA